MSSEGTENQEEKSESEQVDEKIDLGRRAALSKMAKIAIIGGAAIAIGGGGAASLLALRQSQSGSGNTVAPGTTLIYWGDGVDLGQAAINEFKSETGISIQATSIDFFTLQQKLLATGGSGFDIAFTGRIRDLVAANLIAPIDVTKLNDWTQPHLAPIIINPGSVLGPNYVTRFNYLLWQTQGSKLNALVNIWNYDSVGYNPTVLPYYEQGGATTTISYTELYNPNWKGKAALQDEGFTSFSELANVLNATGQLNVSDTVTNLNQNELNSVVNYLTPIVKSGQIKTFWSDLGTIITLMSTSEVVIASCWQPVCFGTRDAGTPCYYARMQNGPFFWWNGDFLPKKYDTSKTAADYDFFNFMMSDWWAANTAHNGYGTVNVLNPSIAQFMGSEFFDWMFNGKATYEPISKIISDTWGSTHPEYESMPTRIQQALFLPDKYFPTGATPRSGSPDPNGNLRDQGSNADKDKITRYFLSPDFPDNETLYANTWTSLKANVPS